MSEPSHTEHKTAGAAYDALILAGGKGSRLEGRDKGWVMHQGLPLIEHALACLAAQTIVPTRVLISANRNIDAYNTPQRLQPTQSPPMALNLCVACCVPLPLDGSPNI